MIIEGNKGSGLLPSYTLLMSVQEIKQEKQLVAKKRYLGHMVFVGQLFLVEIIRAKRMFFCFGVLLDAQPPDEVSLSPFLNLIPTLPP